MIPRSLEAAARQAAKCADEIAASAGSWVDAHNALFGIGGKLVELFPTESERVAFSKTPQFKEITERIGELRASGGDPPAIANLLVTANGQVSVRLPRSIHAALLAEAESEGVSLNQLCLAKLSVQLRAAV